MKQMSSAPVVMSNKNNLLCVIKGIGVAMAVCLVIFSIIALVMLLSPLPESYTKTITVLVSLISIITGAAITAKACGSKGWLWGGIMGAGYILILYIIGMLTVTGFVMDSYILTMLFVGFLAGSVGGIIGNNMKGGRRRR